MSDTHTASCPSTTCTECKLYNWMCIQRLAWLAETLKPWQRQSLLALPDEGWTEFLTEQAAVHAASPPHRCEKGEDYSTPSAIYFTVLQCKQNHSMAVKWLRAHDFDEHTADVYGKGTPNQRLMKATRAVLEWVVHNIDRYGSNQSEIHPELTVFEYWLSHLKYDAMVRQRFKSPSRWASSSACYY